MREIKFRAWNTETKQFELPLYRGAANLDINHILAGSTLLYQQFTGLHDKNGKEIYEGDVISSTVWTEGAEVYYEGGAFCVGRPSSEADFVGGIAAGCMVIGNVFENPELLINT
jgi:hypothetical protein